jgi:hypothetical protein
MSGAAALAAGAAVGDYFSWAEWSPAQAWRPFTDLCDPDVAAGRVDTARSALMARFGVGSDAVPERVAASVLFLGLAARFVSPALAAVSITGVLPASGRDQLWWRPVDSGPLPVAYSGLTAIPTDGLDDAGVADAFTAAVLAELVAPLLAAFRDRFRLSPKVLHGNVASALAGAVTVLASARPEAAEAAGRLLERLLERRPLPGSATVIRPDPATARRYLVRHNCCLYYRIPGAGICGDCVLRPR